MSVAMSSFGSGDVVRFGRRRGWLLHHLWALAQRLGFLRGLEHVDWSRVRRLIFICRGNICRSAYAEQRAREMGLPALSFGLRARAGRQADATAILAARSRGLDLRKHRAHSFSDFLPKPGDLLVAMEPGQLPALMRWTRGTQIQATLLGLWCSPPRPYLQDPYGLSADYFQVCFGCIDAATRAIADRIAALRAGAERISRELAK